MARLPSVHNRLSTTNRYARLMSAAASAPVFAGAIVAKSEVQQEVMLRR